MCILITPKLYSWPSYFFEQRVPWFSFWNTLIKEDQKYFMLFLCKQKPVMLTHVCFKRLFELWKGHQEGHGYTPLRQYETLVTMTTMWNVSREKNLRPIVFYCRLLQQRRIILLHSNIEQLTRNTSLSPWPQFLHVVQCCNLGTSPAILLYSWTYVSSRLKLVRNQRWIGTNDIYILNWTVVYDQNCPQQFYTW